MNRLRASIFAVIAATAAFGQVVEGTVSNSLGGTPLPNVRVSIETSGKTVRTAATDGQGGFRIEGLPPGDYQASFALAGFESPASGPVRRRFQLTAASPVRLDVRLAPLARLSGRLLDSASAPVPMPRFGCWAAMKVTKL